MLTVILKHLVMKIFSKQFDVSCGGIIRKVKSDVIMKVK